MKLNKLFSKKFGVVLVMALASPFITPSTATNAADLGSGLQCSPSSTRSGGIVTCHDSSNSNGDLTGTTVPGIDHDWNPTMNPPGLGPCTDAQGNPSYWSPMYNPVTGGTIAKYCVAQDINGGQQANGVSLKTQAQTLVQVPDPVADFTGNFITGAPVTFKVPNAVDIYTAAVPQVPGVTLVAKPASDYEWNFGDGQTGTGASVQHVYQSTVPDSTKPDNHTVTVTVTRTWNLYLYMPGADPNNVASFGQVTPPGSTLEPNPRTIVQVWSAQTEPNS